MCTLGYNPLVAIEIAPKGNTADMVNENRNNPDSSN